MESLLSGGQAAALLNAGAETSLQDSRALLALQLREAQLRGIFEAASEGILTVDESQTIVMANRAAAQMFRCELGELIGAPLERLIPARFRAGHRAWLAAFGAAGTGERRAGGHRAVTGLRADGLEIPLDAGISQAHVDGLRLYTVILRDLGEPARTAAALRTSEQLLAATFASSSVGMVHVDPDTRRFRAVNAAFCRMTGFSDAELLAMEPDQLNHPDDRLDPALFGALLAGTASYEVEKRLVRKDGSILWVNISGSVVRDMEGRAISVVGVLQDITERHRAQEALRAREARQSLLVRLTDCLRQLDDPKAIALEASRLLGAFVGAARVGYAEDDGNGQTITLVENYTDGVPGIEGTYCYADYGPALLEALRAGRTVVRPDVANDPALSEGERAAHAVLQLGATVNVPLLKAGRLHAVFFVHSIVARDWTTDEVALFQEVAERIRADIERASAEADVRATKAKLEAAMASMNDAVWIADTAGQLVDSNEAFFRVHRLAGREVCPPTLEGWVDVVDVTTADGSVAPPEHWPVPRALRGETGSNVEYGLRHKATGECWTGSYSFAPIRSDSGSIVGAVVTGRDVTEFKRMHAQLQDSHAQLQQLIAAQDQVQEQERLRIAREMHDDLQQGLASILMQAGIAGARSTARITQRPGRWRASSTSRWKPSCRRAA